MSIKPSGFSARELGHVGIFLLRHQTRSGGESVAELDEAEFVRAPDDQIFAQPGEMHSNHRETEQEFADKVAIAHRIETVLAYASKPDFAGNQFAIKDDGGAGERAGAERKNVRSL